MNVFQYANVTIDTSIIQQDSIDRVDVSVPVYNLDRFASIAWKLG
jgi:hypothetical protein